MCLVPQVDDNFLRPISDQQSYTSRFGNGTFALETSAEGGTKKSTRYQVVPSGKPPKVSRTEPLPCRTCSGKVPLEEIMLPVPLEKNNIKHKPVL